MKPGHIRVFDGLRITTEHMEHLQGALHSALEDLRAILGLGRVYYGFEVVAEGTAAVSVQPGLAFDFQKNRITLDEPKSVPVSFAPNEESQYVCIKYDQVEDGQVEGKYTIIWDSCSIVLRPNLPTPADNLIAIARLTRTSGNGSGAFKIESLLATERDQDVDDAADETDAPPVESNPTIAAGDVDATTPSPATTETNQPANEPPPAASSDTDNAAGVAPPVPAATDKETPATAGAFAAGDDGASEVAAAHMDVAGGLPACGLRLQQGVVRLTVDNKAGDYLGALLAEPLKAKLAAANGAASDELSLVLAAEEVALSFPLASLTCQSLITLELELAGAARAADANADERASSANIVTKMQATARGEATFNGDGITQFGLSTIRAERGDGPAATTRSTSELTERAVAHLPLGLSVEAKGDGAAAEGAALLQPLQLQLRLEPTNAAGFRVVCSLTWKGTINREVVQLVDSLKPRLTWETLVAWKALGDPSDSPDR